jgi:hypothetical protein
MISRRMALAGLAVLLLVGVASTPAMAPSRPRPADAPAGAFSAARAAAHLERVASAPRPIGSAEHTRAREYLRDQLASLGWHTEVQETVVVSELGGAGTRAMALVRNVVATRPGTDPTGTVLLAAHYDTVSGSPGAADDGIGLATLLETARALSTERPERNDVVLVVTDAEEPGLLGAQGFVEGWALGPTVVLNHEARGVNGAPATFRVSSPNQPLLRALSRAPGAFAESSTEAVFEALPNDTDFTHFVAAGMRGYDTAISGGSAFYHSPLDNLDHLSLASLQQMGETTLALTRELADLDLATLADGGDEMVTTLPWGLLRYPRAAEMPAALAALVLTVGLVAWRRRTGALTLRRTALAAGAALGSLVAAGGLAYGLWALALRVDPGQASVFTGEPYRPVTYQVGMLLVALAAVVTVVGLTRRRLGAAALTAGALVALALLGVGFAAALPGSAVALSPPVVFAALGGGVAAALPPRRMLWRTAALVAGLVPAAVLLAPTSWTGFEVGLAFGGPLSAFFLAALAWLALPVLDAAWPAVRFWGCALVWLLALAVGAGGLLANRETPALPRQELLAYSLDADTGVAQWAAWREPRSAWSRSLLTRLPATLEQAFPAAGDRLLAHGPAPAADLPAPDLEVVHDVERFGIRELTVRLTSRREASALGLWVDAGTATVRSALVADHPVPLLGADPVWDFGFLFEAAPPDGLEVRLILDQRGDQVRLRVADRTDDLSVVPGFAPPPSRVLVTPELFVTREVRL